MVFMSAFFGSCTFVLVRVGLVVVIHYLLNSGSGA